MMKKYCLLFWVFIPLILSCKKQSKTVSESTLPFSNVVILGNSITLTPHNPSIGWYGDWGMAATAIDSDYVHILARNFRSKDPNAKVNIKNIVPFEVDAQHYDFDANLKALKDSKPDLLIIRIGENVPPNTDMQMFNDRYTALINYFKTDNQTLIVLSGGSVWSNNVDDIMKKHPPYVLLESLLDDGSNFSLGLFADPGVAGHPSNKGMKKIDSLLWNKIITLKN